MERPDLKATMTDMEKDYWKNYAERAAREEQKAHRIARVLGILPWVAIGFAALSLMLLPFLP